MISSNLERCEECREGRSRPHIAAQSAVRCTHHQRSIDQSPHLRDVARSDNQQEVGRKTIAQSRHKSHPGAESEEQRGQPHRQHRKEEQRGGHINQRYTLADCTLHRLTRIFHVDKVGGHTTKHISRPLGIFARSLAVVEDIFAHSLILLHIVLREHFAAILRSKIECRKNEK